jgi:hypothetical protein
MKESGDATMQCYRIWIAGYDDWQPSYWHDVPPRAIALEPAEAAALSAAQAQSFLEGFNSQMLHSRIEERQIEERQSRRSPSRQAAKRLWAVAVPVTVLYEGDARAGETVVGHRF